MKIDLPEPVARQPQASATVRVGLIGPGGFATKVLVPALTEAGAQLEVVGGGAGPSAVAARRHGFSRISTESDVLADDHVDAVVIATRHASHARLCVAALDAGKHVFCEKPIALTQEELESVLCRAANSGQVLAVGFNRRFAPLFIELRNFMNSSGQQFTAIYRVSAGHIDADSWIHDLSQGGGRVLGECCHFVDSLLALGDTPIESVYASGRGQHGVPLQAWDNLVITLTFAGGSIGSIVYSADGSGRLPKERLEVFCGSSAGILEDYRILHMHKDRTQSVKTRSQDKGHKAEIAAFVEGVRTGQFPVPLNEIKNASIATLAIIESLRTGSVVRVAP